MGIVQEVFLKWLFKEMLSNSMKGFLEEWRVKAGEIKLLMCFTSLLAQAHTVPIIGKLVFSSFEESWIFHYLRGFENNGMGITVIILMICQQKWYWINYYFLLLWFQVCYWTESLEFKVRSIRKYSYKYFRKNKYLLCMEHLL